MASSSYSSNGTMKALGLATEYGGPELLTQVTVPRPTLRSENDIIVQIKAAAMNPVDYKVREGQKGGSVTGGPRILGYDGAGVVVHTGSSAHAKRFSVGDEVYFAGDISRSGTNAEFTAVDARIVGFKPKSLSWNEAASLPLVTLTAFEALEEQMNIPERAAPEAKPKSILILAGAGGVGSLAIQISKRLLHLRVVATASRPETSDYVRKLGADVVIDHHKPLREQLTSSGFENGQVDYVLLCHDLSAAKFPEYVDILAPLGTIGTITPDAGIDIRPLFSKRGRLATEFMFARILTNSQPELQGQILDRTAHLVDIGVLQHTLTKTFSLWSDLQEAHRFQYSGKAIGKVGLTL